MSYQLFFQRQGHVMHGSHQLTCLPDRPKLEDCARENDCKQMLCSKLQRPMQIYFTARQRRSHYSYSFMHRPMQIYFTARQRRSHYCYLFMHRQRQRQRQRHRHIETQRDSQPARQTHRQIDTRTHRHTDTQRDTQTQTHSHTE